MPRYDGPAAPAGAAGDRGYAEQRPDTTVRRPTPIAIDAATRAVWGELPATQRPRTIALVAWRPLVKGGLRGFATVELPIGLKIHDVAVLVGKNGPFATLPSKPQIDKEGRHKTDASGKGVYVAVLEWRSRDLADRFSAAVVELVQREHPGALDGSGS